MWRLLVAVLVTTSAGTVNRRGASPDACDDFYEHVCRKWKSENPIPDGRSYWSDWKKAEQHLTEEVSEVLLTSTDLSHLERQARIRMNEARMYATCLATMQYDCRTLDRSECDLQREKVIYGTPFNVAQLSSSSDVSKQQCLMTLSEHIPGALESIYQRLPSRRAAVDDREVESVFSDVRVAAVQIIRSTRWLDTSTKTVLVWQLGETRFYGRPAFVERAAVGNKCYSSLDLKWNSTLNEQLEQAGADRYMKCWSSEASNPIVRFSVLYPSLSANAHYVPGSNYVALYPAFLHHEALINARPRGLRQNVDALYGILGRWYIKDYQNDWMPTDSLKILREKRVCFERLYASKPVPGTNGTMYVNGTRTLGENVADLDGLKFASKALDVRRSRLGLPATSKHEFFKSFAELACENITPSEAESLASRDVHSPWPVRINEALRNNAEFAKAYGCQLGSAMNPAEKCCAWADETIRPPFRAAQASRRAPSPSGAYRHSPQIRNHAAKHLCKLFVVFTFLGICMYFY